MVGPVLKNRQNTERKISGQIQGAHFDDALAWEQLFAGRSERLHLPPGVVCLLAFAAVGIAQIMIFVVMSLSWGINIGVTVLVSQLWGADRKSDAARAAYQAMLLAAGAAAIISFLGLTYGGGVGSLLGARAEVRDILFVYTRII